LSYRSVVEQVDAAQSAVFDALHINPLTTDTQHDAHVIALRTAVNLYARDSALVQHAMHNAKASLRYKGYTKQMSFYSK
jgi:hypothetical protein